MIYKINEACRRARKVDYRRPPTVTRLGAAGGMQGEALSCTAVTGEQSVELSSAVAPINC